VVGRERRSSRAGNRRLHPRHPHGTREVFEENVILVGCEDTGAMEAMMEMGMDEDAAEEACLEIRADGVSVDIDGDYTETLARINPTPRASACSVWRSTRTTPTSLQVATMSGIEPTVDSIASGEYPVSRPLFFYIKAAHLDVIPGLKEYAEFFVSEAAPLSYILSALTLQGPDFHQGANQERPSQQGVPIPCQPVC
jgi:phosphate transport system substrate-binding protein